MKPWKDLSMKERGAFIRVGVKNGITSVDGIRDAYNKFACGGHKFDGTSEPTQRLYQNSQGNLLSQDQYDELVWRAKNNADIAAVNDYREVQVPIRQQQPVNDRMFEGNLNEITVRPDIVYNSDIRNIPALETTEEPISDEWRKRFANSVGQQRRQAQMTPAEQWANYYNNLENLSPEDRRDLMRDRQFANYVQGMAMGTILGVPTSFTSPIFAAMGAADLIYNKNKKWWNYALDVPAVAAPFLHLGMSTPWGQQLAGSALGYANKVGTATEAGYRAYKNPMIEGLGNPPSYQREMPSSVWGRIGQGVKTFGRVMNSPEFREALVNKYGETVGNNLYYIAKNATPDKLAEYERYYNDLVGAGINPEEAGTVYGNGIGRGIPYVSEEGSTISGGYAPYTTEAEQWAEAVANAEDAKYEEVLTPAEKRAYYRNKYGRKVGDWLYRQDKKFDRNRIDEAKEFAKDYQTWNLNRHDKELIRLNRVYKAIESDFNKETSLQDNFLTHNMGNTTLTKGWSTATKMGTNYINFNKAPIENQVDYVNKWLEGYKNTRLTKKDDPITQFKAVNINGKLAIVPKDMNGVPTGNGIIESGNIPIWGKNIMDSNIPFEITTNNTTDNRIYLLTGEFVNQLTDGFTKQLPTEAVRAVLDFQTKVADAIGGVPIGSSVFMSDGIPLVAHDIDLVGIDYILDQNPIIASAKLSGRTGATKTVKIGVGGEAGKIGNKHETSMYTSPDPKRQDFGSVDINVILTELGNDGKRHLKTGLKQTPVHHNNKLNNTITSHVNPIAATLYKIFYPEAYQQQLQEIVLNMRPKDWPGAMDAYSDYDVPFNKFDENGNLVELFPEELLQQLREHPMTYAMWNAMDTAYWLPNKAKHAGRILDVIQYGNPEDVARGLRTWATTKLGGSKNYIAPPNFAKMGFFDDPVKNKWLLRQMGYKFDISNDPQRMQNAFEAYYNDAMILYRGLGIGPKGGNGGVAAFIQNAFDSPENMYKAMRTAINNWNGGVGGIGNGVGLNNVQGSNTYGELGFYMMLPSDLNQATNIEEAWNILQKNSGNGYALTRANLDAMPTVAGIPGVKVGTTSDELLRHITLQFSKIREGGSKRTKKTEAAALDFYRKVDSELHSQGMYALARKPNDSQFVQGAVYVTVGENNVGDRFAMTGKKPQTEEAVNMLLHKSLGNIQIPMNKRLQETSSSIAVSNDFRNTFMGSNPNLNKFKPSETFGRETVAPYTQDFTSIDVFSAVGGSVGNILIKFNNNKLGIRDQKVFDKVYDLGISIPSPNTGHATYKQCVNTLKQLKNEPSVLSKSRTLYEDLMRMLVNNSNGRISTLEEAEKEYYKYIRSCYYPTPEIFNSIINKRMNIMARAQVETRDRKDKSKSDITHKEAVVNSEYTTGDKRVSDLLHTAERPERIKGAIKDSGKLIALGALEAAGLSIPFTVPYISSKILRSKRNKAYNTDIQNIKNDMEIITTAWKEGKIDQLDYKNYMYILSEQLDVCQNKYKESNGATYPIDGYYRKNNMTEKFIGNNNTKSYGGPLELNDRYGIGKYINY